MSRKLLLLTALVILVGTLGLTFKAQRVEASGTTYIRADGSVEPDTATMDFPSDLPLLYVDPENVTGLNPGDSFTISAKIFNLTDTLVWGCKDWHWGCPLEKGGPHDYVLGNLCGLTIDFTWDPNILDYVDHTVTMPVEDYPGGVLHEPVFEVEDDVTEGAYRVSYASLNPAPAFNGDGTVFTMTFEVIQKGTCFLHFACSKLANTAENLNFIPHYVRDGYFGRDVEVSKVEVVEETAEGRPAWVNVTVNNLGGGTENFTLAAYYNTTENGGWEHMRIQPVPQPPLALNERNVTNMPGIRFHYGETRVEGKFVASNKTLRLWWNTTGVARGHYRIKVNTTGVPNEQNITNNVQYSESLIWIGDWIAPSITDVSQTPREENVLPEDEVKINATVVDYGSGVKQVTLNYTDDNGTWISLDMTNLEGNIWNGTIPQFPYGTNVTYIIIAEDNDGNTITTDEMGYEYQYHVIPEFPSFIILPPFMLATLLAVLIYRRKHLLASTKE